MPEIKKYWDFLLYIKGILWYVSLLICDIMLKTYQYDTKKKTTRYLYDIHEQAQTIY
jgi:hypothetical protein